MGLKEKFKMKELPFAHQELPCNPIIGQPYERVSKTTVGWSLILESEGRKNLTAQNIMKRKSFAKGDRA